MIVPSTTKKTKHLWTKQLLIIFVKKIFIIIIIIIMWIRLSLCVSWIFVIINIQKNTWIQNFFPIFFFTVGWSCYVYTILGSSYLWIYKHSRLNISACCINLLPRIIKYCSTLHLRIIMFRIVMAFGLQFIFKSYFFTI